MQTDFATYRARIDRLLQHHLSELPAIEPTLHQAMEHGLLLGGKRVRPFLVYITGQMLGAPLEQLDATAAAIECIHAYSLIHDDLPAMDNDDLRRNLPTVHRAFDEAIAILAGDALQTLAFNILSTPSIAGGEKQQLAMMAELARTAGYTGMCGGQALDLAAEDQTLNLVQLEQIHRLKTGAIIECAVILGAMAAGCEDSETLKALRTYAQAIGLAFQVQDDILDLTSDTQTLGKPQGSDLRQHKSTYPGLLGLEKAQEMAHNLTEKALHALSVLPYNSQDLQSFAHYIVSRNR